jgi:hypothetical protein
VLLLLDPLVPTLEDPGAEDPPRDVAALVPPLLDAAVLVPD